MIQKLAQENGLQREDWINHWRPSATVSINLRSLPEDSGLVGILATIVIVEICHKSAVRLASMLQGYASDIEEPMTVGATTRYGDPTYRACYFEFTIYHYRLAEESPQGLGVRQMVLRVIPPDDPCGLPKDGSLREQNG